MKVSIRIGAISLGLLLVGCGSSSNSAQQLMPSTHDACVMISGILVNVAGDLAEINKGLDSLNFETFIANKKDLQAQQERLENMQITDGGVKDATRKVSSNLQTIIDDLDKITAASPGANFAIAKDITTMTSSLQGLLTSCG